MRAPAYCRCSIEAIRSLAYRPIGTSAGVDQEP
jgi:hypothetical protein